MAPSRVQGLVELGRFGTDPLGRLTALARSSPPGLVPFRIGTVPGFLVTDPGAIREVLEGDDPALLGRGRFRGDEALVRGRGLLHDRGRVRPPGRRSAAELVRSRMPEIARRQSERTADRLRPDVAFEGFDTFRELAFAVDWEALTGRPDDPESLRRLVAVNRWLPRLIGPFGTVLWRLPNEGRRAVAELDATLDSLIADCRASPDDERAFGVAQLVRKADADGITSDADIRGTVKSQFADPLHAWAFWTFYALGRDQALERRWHEEIDGVVGGRAVTPADVERLPLTRKVLLESARLYPPGQTIFREVTADVRVRRRHRSQGGDARAEPVGDAPRRALLGGAAPLRRRALAGGGGCADAACVLPVLRRPARLPRPRCEHPADRRDPRHDRAPMAASPGERPAAEVLAGLGARAERRPPDGPGAALARPVRVVIALPGC